MILARKIWFWGDQNDFPSQKIGFYDDFGVKKGIFEKNWKNFQNFWIFQNLIFDQGFDSNGPGGGKMAKKAPNHQIWQLIR